LQNKTLPAVTQQKGTKFHNKNRRLLVHIVVYSSSRSGYKSY